MLRKKTKDLQPYLLSLLMGGLMFALLFSQNSGISLLISCCLFAITAINLRLGLITALAILPLSSTVSDMMLTIPVLFSPAMGCGIILNLMFSRRKNNFKKKWLTPLILILIPIVCTSFFYAYYQSINAVIAFIFYIIIGGAYIYAFSNYENLVKALTFALTIAAFVALFYALMSNIGSRRLEVGESVRQLANVLGLACIFIITTLLEYKREINKFYRLFISIALVILSFGLIFTVSRGVILAVLISSILTLLFYFIAQKKIRVFFLSVLKLTIALSVVYFLSYGYISSKYGNYLSVLEQRFQSDNVESGQGIREFIWTRTLSSFSTLETLFGVGIQGFEYKSSKAGVFFYAHSVFIDTLASGGIFALVILLFAIIKNFLSSFRYKNCFSFGLLVFIILCYFSHGTVGSGIFWIVLSIVMGINIKEKYYYKNQQYL